MKLIFIILFTVLRFGCVISELPGFTESYYYDPDHFTFPSICPVNTTGSPPECLCTEDKVQGLFNADKNRCEICQTGTSGTFPGCVCEDEKLAFSAYLATLDYKNGCYDPCPENSVGIHPECKCGDQYHTYVESERKCNTRECPEHSTGISPNCVCDTNYIFYVEEWQCFQRFEAPVVLDKSRPSLDLYCPEENGKYPQCGVLVGIGVLKSLVG